MIIVPETEQIKYHYNSINIKILYEGKKPLSDNFIVYSGNFVFRGKLNRLIETNQEVNQEINQLTFDKKIYLQSRLLILIPINIPPNDLCEDYLMIIEHIH